MVLNTPCHLYPAFSHMNERGGGSNNLETQIGELSLTMNSLISYVNLDDSFRNSGLPNFALQVFKYVKIGWVLTPFALKHLIVLKLANNGCALIIIW